MHYLFVYQWQKYEGYMQPESKKFSLDPQITSFEMLQHIIASAFSIKGFVHLHLQFYKYLMKIWCHLSFKKNTNPIIPPWNNLQGFHYELSRTRWLRQGDLPEHVVWLGHGCGHSERLGPLSPTQSGCQTVWGGFVLYHCLNSNALI